MTAFILTICWNFVWPLCSSVREYEFPTYEACAKERDALNRSPKPPSRASCAPKGSEVKR